jgi:hypothetical protein
MNTKQLEFMFMALVAMLASSCGLQVRDNPTVSSGSPVVVAPAEKTYTVGGMATGIKYSPVDTPTNYTDHMPDGIVLLINGEEFPITENGDFTFTKKFKSGEDYEVSILDNGIVIPSNDGMDAPIYLNCDLSNTLGTIIDHNVTDVKVECFLGDIQYKDPGEL